ncbi:hypothetical protein FRC11_013227, partial [Ceratobasidium sp. 423]
MREMVHRLIDFMYRAQAPSLTESDLDVMDNDLRIFHHHKGLLVGPVYDKVKHFDKIAKLHMLRHWTHTIRELGTPDGYNTEGPEHLHIEYAKVPWRALNKVKPLPQMVTYIQYDPPDDFEDADEASLEDVIGRELCRDPESLGIEMADNKSNTQPQGSMANSTREVEDKWNIVPEPVYYLNPRHRMAKTPTVKKLSIHDVVDHYGALNIISNTADFLMWRCQVARQDILISPQNHVSLWHKLYLYHDSPSFAPLDPIRHDVVCASAPRPRDSGIWDIALYHEKPNCARSENDTHEKHGIHRYRTSPVRALFTLPTHLRFFYPSQLTYLELFTTFDTHPLPYTKLHSTQPDFNSGG